MAFNQTTGNPEDVLERLWDTEQEILDTIDSFCQKHKLRYSLAYGTLLGAVRHKGFIPWDDDVDIMMPREDYDQFKALWTKNPPQGYILQDEDIGNSYINNFMKIRKDHTTFLQSESERSKPFQKGIFVDIFPGDRQASGFIAKKVQLFEFMLNLLYNRGYTSNRGGIFSLCEKMLLRLVPRRMHRKISMWFGRRSRRWNHLHNNAWVFPVTAESCRDLYPADLFDNKRQIEFRGKQYDAICDTDQYLRISYGDYMTLPPESERVWTHHPIILDFGRNYEELTEDVRQSDLRSGIDYL